MGPEYRQLIGMRLRLLFVPLVGSLLGVILSLLFLAPEAAEERLLLGPIHSILSYYNLHPDEVSDNFIFTLLLTEPQLKAIKLINNRTENRINMIFDICDSILKQYKPFFYTEDSVKRVGESLYRLRTPELRQLNKAEHLQYKLEKNLLHGNPNPENSTQCLVEAMMDKEISKWCLMQMIDLDARGYCLSHQVLFYTIASSLLPYSFVQKAIKQKCEKMLSEIKYGWEIGMPEALRDIVIEEAAFCGMSKYKAFLTKSMLDFILSLQLKEGCFSITREGPLKECNEHLSAVSMLALAAFLYEQTERQHNILGSYP